MADDFLKAIIPEWDLISAEQQAVYRDQLNQMLGTEFNPIEQRPTREQLNTGGSRER